MKILKHFKVTIKPPCAPKILEVIWKPPSWDLIKINCGDASQGNSGLSACGGITRDFDGRFLGTFASFIGVSNSLIAELNGVMVAIEFTHEKGWRNIWLETDFVAIVKAFSPHFKVSWQVRTKWINFVNLTSNMSFIITHIFK